jgi:hypothetical protein
MYQISRAIYRELAPHLGDTRPGGGDARSSHEHVLHACEAVIERLARDPYCFADPTRTLFYDIRSHFPMNAQEHVHRVVTLYMGIAQQFIAEHPLAGFVAISGEPPRCRATTRKGDACRRVPLPQNGYCPSHQHLAETEDGEWALARFKLSDRRRAEERPVEDEELDGRLMAA